MKHKNVYTKRALSQRKMQTCIRCARRTVIHRQTDRDTERERDEECNIVFNITKDSGMQSTEHFSQSERPN